jgi:hypothetical protein
VESGEQGRREGWVPFNIGSKEGRTILWNSSLVRDFDARKIFVSRAGASCEFFTSATSGGNT